jgi:hypothetical protein
MAIKVDCSACGKKLRAKDRYAGRRATCPACGRAIHVPVRVPATPNGEASPLPSRRRPTTAQNLTKIAAEDGEEDYVAPAFRPLGSSSPDVVPPGHRGARPAMAGRNGSRRRRGLPRDPWYDSLSRSLGLVSMGIGGAILILGLRVNHERGGGGPGALLVVGCSLAALIAGAGVLLLADVARSLRRLSRLADRDEGIE